ncbi:MAG: 50S ribosomal protein L29 [Terriglobia bacterium]
MKAEKMREWADNELNAKTREFSEQLFRLRFQLRNGQTDILVKIRELRKDIARAKTLQRERELR